MFEILATDSAKLDLVRIRDYLLEWFANPLAWENLSREIRTAYETLKSQPYAFVPCKDERLAKLGYHKCSVGSYLFIYRVDESNSIVHVLRYFHELQDYEAQL